MQNFRTKARASSGIFSGKKVAACMLSVAVAAVIFWGITLTGNTEHSDEQMTVAQALRAAGDFKIIVGGAVLTQDYADSIGADCYAPNAVSAVNYANSLQ